MHPSHEVKVSEIKIDRILNPTGIDLGQYVVNPYRGCEFGCLYCYVRQNKNTLKDKRIWGDFVDVRINACELLEKEIAIKKPDRILLGSTTECFQPIEGRYKIMFQILEILNKNGIRYNILTRSPLALEAISLLKAGFCEGIYFTLNDYAPEFKKVLEPHSPSFAERRKAALELEAHGINVIPYFCPILPGISDAFGILESKGFANIQFECLNFNLGNIGQILQAIRTVSPEKALLLQEMAEDGKKHDLVWKEICDKLSQKASETGKKIQIYSHQLEAYFSNKYRG